MSDKKVYTISIHTENHMGLLYRISGILLRRRINIENINASFSDTDQIFRWWIDVKVTEEQMKKLNQQIEKQVDIIQSTYREKVLAN